MAFGDSIADARAAEAQAVSGASDLRYHQTQIVSGASKVNLRIDESLPVLVDGMTQTVARLLPARPDRED